MVTDGYRRLRAARLVVLSSVTFALFAATAAALAADAGKTLRVVFPIAETTFDPQSASDAASDGIVANIYEAMLDYDYLARPVKLVPRTLEALPAVEDGGKTYICRIRKGILFTPDPAFKGKPRELTAADHAYGLKRLLDPVVKSPWPWLIEGKIVGSDEARAKAAKTGNFDYDAPISRPRDRRPLHAEDPAEGARPALHLRAGGAQHGRHRARGRRRLRPRPRRAPGRNGAVHARRIQAQLEDRARGQPWLSRSHLHAGGPDSTGVAADRHGAQGQAAAARRPHRDQHHRGGPGALARVPQPRARPPRAASRRLRRAGARRTASCRPELAARASSTKCCCGRTRGGPTSTWRIRSSAATRRRRSRCAARSAWPTTSTRRSACCSRAARCPATSPIPPDIAGYDPNLKTQAQLYDPAAARALLDRFGYKDRDGDGYRETPDGKPLVLERWSTPTSAAAAGRRAVEEEHGRDRPPDRVQEGPAAGAAQDGAAGQDPDARRRLERRLSRRRELHAAPLRAERRTGNDARFDLPEFNRLYEQARALPDSPRAHEALRPDDRADARLRAVANDATT